MDRSSRVYDVIILGAGPAGITASIYAARKKMDLAVIADNIGGQVGLTAGIENYTGFQFISGEDLSTKFKEHAERFRFNPVVEEVQKVEREGELFKVKTNMCTHLGRTAIIATGRTPRKLNVLGEEEFKNRGVSYCATCDAPFFEGLDVAVIGGGNSGLEAVIQLSKIAKSIRLIELKSRPKADPILIDKAKASGKVEILTNTRTIEIVGDKTVTGIRVQRDEGEMLLPVRGVFIEVGSTPNSNIVDFLEKNSWGEIPVNCRCETNVPGLFAAGDVTDAPEKQIVVASGEGCKAALSAFRYLSERRG